jgi:putative oxidoreductase
MQKILNHTIWTTHALLLARILMGALFVISGVQKFQNIEMVTGYIGSAGLPAAALLAWLAAALEVLAGVAIMVGYYFKEAALALVVFVVLASFIFHNPSTWDGEGGQMQQMMFLKNMAIAAGLLFMAAHGAGNTWKLKLGK